jgi:hypothetical protein
MEPGLSPDYRHEEEEEGKEGLEEEEEEASPGFVDSWLRRWPVSLATWEAVDHLRE